MVDPCSNGLLLNQTSDPFEGAYSWTASMVSSENVGNWGIKVSRF